MGRGGRGKKFGFPSGKKMEEEGSFEVPLKRGEEEKSLIKRKKTSAAPPLRILGEISEIESVKFPSSPPLLIWGKLTNTFCKD